MARIRDEDKFNKCRESLLEVGQQLFICSSFASVGLNDILKKAGTPKGSFYHYFESKEDFGLQVVERYHQQHSQQLTALLSDDSLTAYEHLRQFYQLNIEHFNNIEYCQGCLMANLSQEIADVNETLRVKISELSAQNLAQITGIITRMDTGQINLAKLTAEEAAQFISIAWQGAVMSMKLEKNCAPLKLFMKYFFD